MSKVDGGVSLADGDAKSGATWVAPFLRGRPGCGVRAPACHVLIGRCVLFSLGVLLVGSGGELLVRGGDRRGVDV